MKQLALVAALIALPLAATAGPKEKAAAKVHVDNAMTAHQAGQFDVALRELESAYAIDPAPDLLYAIGQVQVKLANCPVAITYYEKFLATNPGPEPSAAANEAIKSCQATLAAQPPAPEPEPTPEPAPPPPPAPPQPEGRKFDVLGTSLVGLGVVSTVVGVVMYSSALNNLDDAETAPTLQEHDALVDDAKSKRTYAVVFGVAGVAAIGVGVWHYLSFRKSGETSRVTVAPTANGGMVTFGGTF